jgi:HEAT repeat-containing protein 3
MGKYKKGKSKPHKKNPVGLPIVDDDNLDMDDDKPSTVQSITEQLSSPSPDEKMCGLQALSHLCQNERNIQAIVSSDIVRIASPFLVDPGKLFTCEIFHFLKITTTILDFNIRHAAAGAIRNLSAVSVDICENLVEQDVFTPLIILLNQYASNNWIPSNEKKTNQLDQKSDTFLQAVNIVWNLCESTSIALEYFNQSNLLENCLIRCLNYEVFGLEIGKFMKIISLKT